MKIYTKNGDQGETCLIGGKKVFKWNARLEAYGTVDELNSHLGLLIQHIPTEQSSEIVSQLTPQLMRIQNELFNTGSLLACEQEDMWDKLPQLKEENIHLLETAIDDMDLVLSTLKNFILPGGSLSAAQAHICRTICRRAERKTLEAFSDQTQPPYVIPYLNRLSDYFFVLARYLNQKLNKKDIEWSK